MRFDWSLQLFAWKMTNVRLLFIALGRDILGRSEGGVRRGVREKRIRGGRGREEKYRWREGGEVDIGNQE